MFFLKDAWGKGGSLSLQKINDLLPPPKASS